MSIWVIRDVASSRKNRPMSAFTPIADKPLQGKIYHCPLAAVRSGGTDRFRPRNNLEIHLFSDQQRVINFNAEIPDGALNLGVAKQ